ncbi:MAG: hypothetical protein IT183_10990 [Acidobacteria bacterium]|nr:hypothetical protein [Acidobacteriota bacterium]
MIRFLQAKYSRKFEALANPGDERVAPVKLAAATHFPDIVLNEDKRLAGLVEIETAASVNNLETMAKWVPFSRARVPFHLYVPVQGYEAALRLAEAHQVKAAEIWTYRPATEGFDLVRMFVDASLQVAKPSRQAATKPVAAKPVAAKPAAAKPVAAKPAPAAKAAPKAEAPKNGSGAAKKVVKPAKPSPKAAAKPAAKAKTRPAAKAKAPAPRRPAAKPVRASSAKPASKGGKKGASGRKGR